MSTPKTKFRYSKIKNGHKVSFETQGHGETVKQFYKRVRKELKKLRKYE